MDKVRILFLILAIVNIITFIKTIRSYSDQANKKLRPIMLISQLLIIAVFISLAFGG